MAAARGWGVVNFDFRTSDCGVRFANETHSGGAGGDEKDREKEEKGEEEMFFQNRPRMGKGLGVGEWV
jgi:hypothetical protein